MTLTHFDCFSGIGGFALGLERTGGFRTIGFCEIDPYCQRVLRRHWPEVPVHDDVRSLPRVPCDLLTGGVPCQPASVAGSRRGRADERWLWDAFLEVVSASRPTWVLAENPLGIVSLRPHGLGWICGSLRELGYDAWPVVISAHDVGAPHLRRRVWIVAHAERGESQHDGAQGIMADPFGFRLEGLVPWTQQSGDGRSARLCSRETSQPAGWWDAEPDVGRVAARVPARVDRLRALGNAVVPQIVELIGYAILNVSSKKEDL